MVVSAWERQGFVEAEVRSNGVASLLRVGLSDELDLLQHNLAATVQPLDAAQAKSSQADIAFGDVRTQLITARGGPRSSRSGTPTRRPMSGNSDINSRVAWPWNARRRRHRIPWRRKPTRAPTATEPAPATDPGTRDHRARDRRRGQESLKSRMSSSDLPKVIPDLFHVNP